MKLNHLDLHVPNVLETRDFFVGELGFTLISAPSASTIAILKDEGGFVLVLQKQKHPNEKYPEGFHVGFYVDNRSEVDALHIKFKEKGMKISDIDSNRRGYFFYTYAPGEILIEVNSTSANL